MGEHSARAHIASLRRQIEDERALTLGRIAKGREATAEWDSFAARTAPMRREIDATIKLLADVENLKPPAPVIFPRN